MTKKQLSVIESSVYELLPRGRENRKSIKSICKLIDLDERSVQSIINRLIISHNIPIVADRRGEGGVFIPLTEEERRVALISIKRQVAEMQKRVEAVENIDLDNWDKNLIHAYQGRLGV